MRTRWAEKKSVGREFANRVVHRMGKMVDMTKKDTFCRNFTLASQLLCPKKMNC